MIYTIEELKEMITPIAVVYRLSKVYLFGSYARGEADESSDIDIATVWSYEGYGMEFFELQAELESVLNKKVDLLTERNINEAKSPIAISVKENYSREKVLLYENKAYAKEEW